MVIAYDPDVEFPYVLKKDMELPKEKQTVFSLKTLNARENQAVEDAWITHPTPDGKRDVKVAVAQNRGTMAVYTLQRGLRGWDNLLDARGKPVPFLPLIGGSCPMANIDRIDPDDRHELAAAIENGAKVAEDDLKNSPSPSGSLRGK